MKIQSRKFREDLFFLAAANLGLRWSQPYRIQTEIIETKNFMPEALAIHHFPESYRLGLDSLDRWMSKGEMWMPVLDFETCDSLNLMDSAGTPLLAEKPSDDADDDDEDWDEDDEDWDEDDDEDDDDEDWDEDDEDWDEDDEDWDEDDDLDKDDDKDGDKE